MFCGSLKWSGTEKRKRVNKKHNFCSGEWSTRRTGWLPWSTRTSPAVRRSRTTVLPAVKEKSMNCTKWQVLTDGQIKKVYLFILFWFLGDPGKARGCSTNTYEKDYFCEAPSSSPGFTAVQQCNVVDLKWFDFAIGWESPLQTRLSRVLGSVFGYPWAPVSSQCRISMGSEELPMSNFLNQERSRVLG